MEIGLVKHVEKFLVEMGAGFAFMGRQYHINVSGDDYYIDILMYNVFLHRYLVIELKDTEFMPEYIGKLNFYCSAVDDILCREGDNRTIGLLLCKSKDCIKAEYALRDIQKPIGISDYELGQALPSDFRGSLPSIEEIEKELESDSKKHMALPNDPIMLLSVVNLKLRDFYKNLDALCEDMDADKADLCAKLKAVGYEYDAQRNQFV